MSALENCLCPECHGPYIPRDPDPWEGRLNGFCMSCAEQRCDAYGHASVPAGEVGGLFAALTAEGFYVAVDWNGLAGWTVSLAGDDLDLDTHLVVAERFSADSLVGALRAATEWANTQEPEK